MKFLLTVTALVVLAVVAVYAFLARPWHLRWGATDVEVAASLPGDEMVSQPKVSATHAITIQGSPAEVWPWLVQMGQGRAGFYSYEWIENLIGLNIRNADQILPEFQGLKVGDLLPLASDGFGVPVAVLEPNRALVLGGRVDAQTKGRLALKDKDAYYQTSWAFVLQPISSHSTRLIERFRMDWVPTLSETPFTTGLSWSRAALSWSGGCSWASRSAWSPAVRDD